MPADFGTASYSCGAGQVVPEFYILQPNHYSNEKLLMKI
jgi:hypothetical protein